VPDEQNFAKTPLFVALMEKKRQPPEEQTETARRHTWTLPSELATDIYGGAYDSPPFGSFETGKLTDLEKWQDFYKRNTNFVSKSEPHGPAHGILLALSKFDPIRKELLEANQRPFACLPAHSYFDLEPLLSFLAEAKGLSQYLRLHATACLEAGENDQALADIKLNFRLREALMSDPMLISHLVGIAVLAISADPIWEGLARDQWNQERLLEIQNAVSTIDLLADFNLLLRGERAYRVEVYEIMRRQHAIPSPRGNSSDVPTQLKTLVRMSGMIPSWFFYRNQINENQLLQEFILTPSELEKRRVPRQRYEAIERSLGSEGRALYNIFAALGAPYLARDAGKTARAQTVLDQVAVACALARFRLSNNDYPDRLEELVPRFIEKLPTDVMSGEPLKYRRSADGGYVLYSVGWNQKDDGGVRRPNKGTSVADEEGDWVWVMPRK
jgi:hypothetical protein